jgi:predicted ribosome quality control (RQC) complex YloA/Tae2 family protein
MASTFKAVADTMEDMSITMYRVKGRGNSLIGYNNDPKTSVDVSITRLKKLLQEQQGDFVRVELIPPGKRKEDGTGGDMTVIKMEVDLSSLSGRVVAGIEGHDKTNYREMLEKQNQQIMELQKELLKREYDNKIAELEKRIEGTADADPINQLIGAITPAIVPVIPQIIAAFLTRGNASEQNVINGLPNQNRDEIIARIENVIPDIDVYLEKIAVMCEQDPNKIKFVLTML